jgi:acyl-CoA thioesterase-2
MSVGLPGVRGRVRLEEILDLELVGPDLFRGASPDTNLQRIFGGQVAAQALVAATRTVRVGRPVHSLHAYFLRPGKPGVPTDYVVDRVRDGGSFSTRRVTGSQAGTAIFSLSASFQLGDQDGPDHADLPPDVETPEQLAHVDETDAEFRQWHRTEWPDWDLRRASVPRGTSGRSPVQQVWVRHAAPLPDDPVLHACALTYVSDMTLLGCSVGAYADERPNLQVASLDHAVWFLRPFRADEWLLYDQSSPSAGGGRGLNIGRVFDRAGALVAAVVQEGLVRQLRG